MKPAIHQLLVRWLPSCHSSPHSFFGSQNSLVGKRSGSACSVQPLGVLGVPVLREDALISCYQMLEAQPWVGEKQRVWFALGVLSHSGWVFRGTVFLFSLFLWSETTGEVNCAGAVQTSLFSPRKCTVWTHLMSSILFGKGSLFSACLNALEFKTSSSSLDHCKCGSFWPWLARGPGYSSKSLLSENSSLGL